MLMSSAAVKEELNVKSSSSNTSAVDGKKPTPYNVVDYWNKRYEKMDDSSFDWYVDWARLEPVFTRMMIPKSSRILNLGCGNSQLSEDLFKSGYHNMTNIDISPTLITSMQKRYSVDPQLSSMKWICMDACNMREFEDERFDIIIDKGTLDALICGDNVEDSRVNVISMIQECHRVLTRQGGQMWLFTHGPPSIRLSLLQGGGGGGGIDWSHISLRKLLYSNSALVIRKIRQQLKNGSLSSVNGVAMAKAVELVQRDIQNGNIDTSFSELDMEQEPTEASAADTAMECYVYICTKNV